MPSWLLKVGAILALAQTISGAHIYVKTTSPPANGYVTHCTVIIDDDLFGCKGSSKPFKKRCGRNSGIQTKSICDTGSVTVDWSTGKLEFKGPNGDHANCTLSTTESFGECDTSDPDRYPKMEINEAGSLISAGSALYGLGPIVAGMGMLI